MTLRDLAALLRPKLILLVAIPIAALVAVFLGMTLLVQPTYSATSKVQVDQSLAAVRLTADTAAAEVASSMAADGIQIATKSDTSNLIVSITATGNSASACIDAANRTAERTMQTLSASHPSISKRTVAATSAEKTSTSPLKCAVAAALAALVAIMCVIVIADMRSRRIHSLESIEEATGLPCLGNLGDTAQDNECLFLCVKLAGRNGKTLADSVCIMPVGRTRAAQKAAEQLSSMNVHGTLKAAAAPPASECELPSLKALEADVVVLAVEENVSTFNDLEDVLHELLIAKIVPVGFLFARAEGNRSARPRTGPAEGTAEGGR